jgi:hypothetical protein
MQLARLVDFFNNSYLGESPETTTRDGLKKASKFMELSGEGLCDRKICHNQDDFYSLESLEDIPDLYFFTFSDMHGRKYGCDIRSFDGYIDTYKEPGKMTQFNPEDINILNPYDRQQISKQSITNYIAKKFLLFQNGILCSHQKTEFDEKTSLKMKILDIFQIIYRFGYPVDHKWLLNLSIKKLHEFYLKLEDIWNFRLNLTPQAKYNIIGSNVIFTHKEKSYASSLFAYSETDKLLELCINNIEILVTGGMSKNDCITGANYVLMALVEVSTLAAENLPQFAFAIGLAE